MAIGEIPDPELSGWPHVAVADGGLVEIDGESLWGLIGRARRINDVPIIAKQRPLPAYEIEIGGKCVRFAAGEVSNNIWVVASEDAEIRTQRTATHVEQNK